LSVRQTRYDLLLELEPLYLSRPCSRQRLGADYILADTLILR
jgi:hypothetical protein